MRYVILFFKVLNFFSSCHSSRQTSRYAGGFCEPWLAGMVAEIDFFCIRRDPSVLQLAGASRVTASILFQVYHLPDGHFEKLENWVKRTISENPVETMYGLYDMVSGFA